MRCATAKLLILALSTPALLTLKAQEPTTPSDEEQEAVETVKLGGEDRAQKLQEGVGEAEGYTATPDSQPAGGIQLPSSSEEAPLPDLGAGTARPVQDDTEVGMPSMNDPSHVAFAQTRRNARTMSLSVPATRGVITDRKGAIMANSEVAWQPSIHFSQLQSGISDAELLKLAHNAMDAMAQLGVTLTEKSEKQLLDHYRYRRWLPLPVGLVMRKKELSDTLRQRLESVPHCQLLPVYVRKYPYATSSSHILGYTGIEAKLPQGPINYNDPIFARQQGRSGLEKSFNEQLVGRDGIWRLMFDEKGTKILDELQVKPQPGGTLVTTLDLDWQLAAEKALRENTLGRGAFVMIDCITGEIVVMASVPNFNPNTFIPFITQKNYEALQKDRNTPLVSRAFAGMYPPASTFKTITVAAALQYGVIGPRTSIHCPYSIRIGGHEFRNHSQSTGSMDCVEAIVRSNNPFMYQIAATRDNRLGAERLVEVARRFGFGSRSGIPLPDKAGNVPDESWMHRNYGRGFMQGDAANMSIGQGALLATPLQVAHAISAIANGRYLPKLQLIRQILDRDGNVVYTMQGEKQSNMSNMSSALRTVREGMARVVSAGTGRRAQLSYVSNAGKTGTAQWGKPSDDCRLAWFAGYLPADAPRYAYVALYEGRPGQKISGGSMAANIVKSFFESIKPSMREVLKKHGADPEVIAQKKEQEEKEQSMEDALQRQERRKEINRQYDWSDGRSRN